MADVPPEELAKLPINGAESTLPAEWVDRPTDDGFWWVRRHGEDDSICEFRDSVVLSERVFRSIGGGFKYQRVKPPVG